MGSQLQDEISPVARLISALGDYKVDRLQVYGQQCLQPSNTNSTNGIYTSFLLFLIAGGMGYVVLLISVVSVCKYAHKYISTHRPFLLLQFFLFTVLVFNTREVYLFPSRTQKSSHVVPMVLHFMMWESR